jgi:hypothetical protein
MLRIAYSIIAIFMLASCGRISPGGFWLGYRQTEIVEQKLDHGPWGGTTEIHWVRSGSEKPFSAKQIIGFAAENEWEYVVSIESAEESDYSNAIFLERFGSDSKTNSYQVLRFRSDKIAVDDNYPIHTSVNCFVLLNNDNSSMAVFFRWGDFIAPYR